jgi:hypothetical protein
LFARNEGRPERRSANGSLGVSGQGGLYDLNFLARHQRVRRIDDHLVVGFQAGDNFNFRAEIMPGNHVGDRDHPVFYDTDLQILGAKEQSTCG